MGGRDWPHSRGRSVIAGQLMRRRSFLFRRWSDWNRPGGIIHLHCGLKGEGYLVMATISVIPVQFGDVWQR